MMVIASFNEDVRTRDRAEDIGILEMKDIGRRSEIEDNFLRRELQWWWRIGSRMSWKRTGLQDGNVGQQSRLCEPNDQESFQHLVVPKLSMTDQPFQFLLLMRGKEHRLSRSRIISELYSGTRSSVDGFGKDIS